jgi:hypothetical protein
MRFLRLGLVALLVLLAACKSDDTTTSTTPDAPKVTTTTGPAVDRAAVDGLIDRIGAETKIVLKAESGDISGRQLSDAAAQLIALTDEQKDPAKRPAGVPAKQMDDLVASLGATGTAAANLARAACPAGISTPRCTDLYLALNQAQTSLINAVQALNDYDSRAPGDVQNILYG